MKENMCNILWDIVKERAKSTALYIKNKLEQNELDDDSKKTAVGSIKHIHEDWKIWSDLC